MEETAPIASTNVSNTAETDDQEVVQIRHLAKSFGSNQVLKDISMELKKGENLVILGRSGTGKSVTIKCIAGLLEYDQGQLKVFGNEVARMSDDELKELRTKVGFLFQSAALYDSMTVKENLEFPLKRVLKVKDSAEIEQRINEALEAVGLPEAAGKMPSELSGGMRKRIGLARTIIVRPQIMLYDEPTTGLDPITSREISELILTMQEKYKISSIIITHDIPCARITANRMLIMDEGRFVAEGTFDELSHSDDEFINSFFKT